MPCYSPLEGFRSETLTASGKRKLVFTGGFRDLPVTVACGQCIGCRLERSRQWAIRLMHEKQFHTHASFLTLTYDDKHLPAYGSLCKRDFQLFLKRMRKRYGALRYFHCGEYGETSKRPHYHAILYGVQFRDRTFHTRNPQGQTIYRSQALDDLWGHGHCLIGEVSFESAAYVARYILKKVTGEPAAEHYRRVDPETGEIVSIQPEYITMSLKPAIGAAWFDEFRSDVYPDDFVVMRGHKARPPRYYDKKLEAQDPALARSIKARRMKNGKLNQEDNTPQRLAIKKEVKEAQIKSLTRKL